jgi:hypothetical protein
VAIPRDPFAPRMHESHVITIVVHESLGISPISQMHFVGLGLGLPVGAPILNYRLEGLVRRRTMFWPL